MIDDMRSDDVIYIKILYKLLLQGLLILLEPELGIRCKVEDKCLIKAWIPELLEEYTEVTQEPLMLLMDEEDLDPEGVGGIELRCLDEKVFLVNTLDVRLESVCVWLMPEVRLELFGANPNRVFFE